MSHDVADFEQLVVKFGEFETGVKAQLYDVFLLLSNRVDRKPGLHVAGPGSGGFLRRIGQRLSCGERAGKIGRAVDAGAVGALVRRDLQTLLGATLGRFFEPDRAAAGTASADGYVPLLCWTPSMYTA